MNANFSKSFHTHLALAITAKLYHLSALKMSPWFCDFLSC